MRRLLITIGVATLMVACTPGSEADSTTTAPPRNSTVPDPSQPLVPPDVGDPDDLAASWLEVVDGFTPTSEEGIFEQDAMTAIGLWLPDELVEGSASVVYGSQEDSVVVVAVVPSSSWRGDPGLVPALASLDAVATEVSEGVYRTETEAGLTIALWSNGDGFLVAASLDEDASVAYLTTREEQRSVLPVWASGDCLYLDPVDGLPWAPILLDRVVACSGPHNAEVISAEQVATDATVYDEDGISYQRNYECDRAYEESLGAQRDHTPELITYMPDEDEFARGDRYLACVIRIDSEDGPLLVAGRITDRTDLTWNPEVGTCYADTLATSGVDCADVHTYEYVGDATTDLGEWPDSTQPFIEACEPLLDTLTRRPAQLDVFPTGLYAFAFERGERTLRCMAFATDGASLLDVVGSFTGEWRIRGQGGIPVGSRPGNGVVG